MNSDDKQEFGRLMQRKSRKMLAFLALLPLMAALWCIEAHAQLAGTGSIQGTVTDQSGAVVLNAVVAATNAATGVTETTKTGADGLYSFPNLPVGAYSLSVSAPQFEKEDRTGIVLEVGSSITINVSLQVGQTSQVVTVASDDIALQTEDASFKQTVDQTTLTELPLNGRQVTSLVTLSGGSAPAPSNSIIGTKSFYDSVVISVAGGMGNSTDYRLDGGDWNDYMYNVNLPFPFPDAVSQFSVESTDLSAQNGLHPGGLVNVVTRSGSNQWHGSAFEFIRNNIIDATNFFSTSKDSLHQNQYGGTFGGRVIPDKLFFFNGYQRTTSDQAQADNISYVPTAANLNGDFSVTDGAGCESSGTAVQLLNPQSGALLMNNQISTSYFVAPSLAVDKYLPPTTDPCGKVSYAIPSVTAENQYVERVDYTLSQKNNIYERYLLDGYQAPAFFSNTNALLSTQSGNYERVQGLTIVDTHTFNPHTINSLHVTGTRRRIDRSGAAGGISPSTVGIQNYSPYANFFELSVSSKWSLYCGTCALSYFNVNTFAYGDDLNMLRGKHQIVLGGDFVRSQFNANNTYESNGDFSFSGTYSQKGPAGSSKGGTGEDANLDFLTGAMHSYTQTASQQNAYRGNIPDLYVQDTYHPNQRLAITAGVRWNPEYLPVDYFRRGSDFNDANFLAGKQSTVFVNAPAGMVFYGDPGVPPAFTQNSPWQFSPRLGIAWDPTGKGKTVLRAGAAMVYDETNFFTFELVTQNAPFSPSISNTPVNTPLEFASPWATGTVTTNPFPSPFHPPSTVAFSESAKYYVMLPHFHAPYMLQWTASVEHELGKGWQAQLDYIGNHSSFDTVGEALNPAVYIPGTCGSSACSTTGNEASRFALTIANPTWGPYYAGGGGGFQEIGDEADSTYEGVIATLQHRLSSTFTLLTNYTWSHCINIQDAESSISVTVEDPSNLRLDRSNCGADFRDIYNLSLVANSRFHLDGWQKAIVNGWEIAPLLTVRDGGVFSISSGQDNSLTDIGNDRPNLINPSQIFTHNKLTQASALYLNVSAFQENASGTYGNIGRNSLRGPGYVQLDSELSRFFPITEALKLDFRIEAFNVLNHADFSTPSGNISSSTFGQITSTAYGARIFQGALKFIF
jgi:hypothetical protein